MLGFFRIIAVLEGISFLLIFGITMPLKYWANMGEPNKWVGYAHGVLFILYIILLALLFFEKKFNIKKTLKFFVASLLPFGTFYMEQKYFGKQK
jgi:integral membrane protein